MKKSFYVWICLCLELILRGRKGWHMYVYELKMRILSAYKADHTLALKSCLHRKLPFLMFPRFASLVPRILGPGQTKRSRKLSQVENLQ